MSQISETENNMVNKIIKTLKFTFLASRYESSLLNEESSADNKNINFLLNNVRSVDLTMQ